MHSPPSCHSHRVAQGKVLDTLLCQSFFLNAPRGIRLPTLSVRDQFFLFFPPPRGTEQKSPTHCSVGRRPNFFSHATSWKRAKVISTLLYQSSTEFFSFPRHLVAQSKCPPATHCSIGPRPNFYLFHATSWHSKSLCLTTPSVRDRNPFFLMEIYAISWHKAKGL